MDQAAFGELVDQVVEHLYDLPYLQTHPLGRLLVTEPAGDLRGRALQRALLEAIQVLRPPTGTAGSAHAWRTYRYLFLRFVQVTPARDVARELAISERQARRTYREALDALASVLWDRSPGRGQLPRDEGDGEAAAAPPTAAADSLLDQEVRHLAASGQGVSTELSEVVDGLRWIVGPLAQRHGCVYSASLDPNLPRLGADRVAVRQILLNLCAMAFERGPGRLRLEARPDPAGVQIVLEWLPADVEVSPPAPSLLAEPHPRSSGTPSPQAERGLGGEVSRLAVSRRLVEAEGGSLAAHTAGGRGVVVAVSLPAARRPTVLVVDDNPGIVAVFRRYLETAGLEVLAAATGGAGLRLARDARPAAITLDVMMASQDGWETLQLLKNQPETHDIPVLICSVLREEELARFLGAAELLPKPVTRPALLAALARCGLPVRPEGPGEHRSSP